MTRPTTTGKAQDLITFTRSTTGTYLDSVTYGDELVTNGTFDTDIDGWTSVNANLSASNGGMLIADNGSFSVAYQAVSTVIGKTYIIYVDAIDVPQLLTFNFGQGQAAPTGNDTYFDGTGEIINNLTVVGSFKHIFTAVATTTYISFGTNSINAITIDNVSVKELTSGQGAQGTPLLRTAAIDEARIEYDASGNCLGLLMEEEKTNLLTYSEDFTSGWGALNIVATPNIIASPDGAVSGAKLQEDSSGTGGPRVYPADLAVLTANQAQTFSCFFKAGTSNYAYVTIRHSNQNIAGVEFDLVNGTVNSTQDNGNMTVNGSDITSVGNGWYRCSVTATCSVSTSSGLYLLGLSDGTGILNGGYPNYALTGKNIYAWGAQVETSAFPTSYIPTSGSTVTRNKDVTSLPVERFAYNQSQGSIVCHFAYFFEQNSGNRRTYEFGDGTDSNVIRVLDHNNVNQLQANVKSGGAGVAGILINAPTMLSGVKTFQTYKLNGYIGGADGTLAGTDSNGLLPVGINKLSIGSNGAGVATMNGHITSLQYYPKKLTDAQLELLTQPSASPTMNLTFNGQATSTLVEGFHD